MTIEDFELMNGTEKMQTLAEQSVFLAQRMEGCFKISLYQLEGFYIEIYFHLSQFCYKSVRVFSDTSELSPYLETVDISGLCEY